MKKHYTLLLFVLVNSLYSQTQFGIKAGYQINSLKTTNFNNISDYTGYSIGISSLSFLTNNIDLIVDVDYSSSSLKAESYNDFYNAVVPFTNDITINTLSVEALLNYYLLLPETNAFHIGLQGGLGTTLLNRWSHYDNDDFFDGINNIKPYYSVGISGGTEKLRIGIRYNSFFGNYLSELDFSSVPNNSNLTDEIYAHGKNTNFSLNITYYFKNFLD